MTVSSTFRQRLTACIAILAVLLLFIAPVVSKTLMEPRPQNRHSAHPDHQIVTSQPQIKHAGMHNHQPVTSQPQSEHSGMSGHQMMAMDSTMPGMMHHDALSGEFACGYCELLVHVPLMMWIFIPFIWLMLLISRAPPLPPHAPPVIRRRVTIPCPRAPPEWRLC